MRLYEDDDARRVAELPARRDDGGRGRTRDRATGPPSGRRNDCCRHVVDGGRVIPEPRFLPPTRSTWRAEADVVVVGTGAAGPAAAVSLASSGRRVVVLAKGELMSGSTPLAQGGLAVVTDPEDSFASHASDTIVAAAGLADDAIV